MNRRAPILEDLLASLVRCPSVNPAGAPCSETTGESRMSKLLAGILRPWASEITISEAAPRRPNFTARFAGRDRSRCYAFEAHSDTVGISGMTIDPFAGTVAAGRLYGRGACDTKGSMAAMILAIVRHIERHRAPACDLLFLSTCDEELGGLGARRMVEEGLRCDGIVIGEPTDLHIVESHKGAIRFRLHVKGKAAHSAYPEFGANSIHGTAAFIRELEHTVTRLTGPAEWPEPGPPTVSVGIIKGGDQVNRVPDLTVLEMDFRIPPDMAPRDAQAAVSQSAEAVSRTRPGISIEIETTQSYPAFRLGTGAPFRSKLRALAGPAGRSKTARYATNAGFFASVGIPCVVFGPGSPADAHTADESIALDAVEEASTRLQRFLEEL